MQSNHKMTDYRFAPVNLFTWFALVGILVIAVTLRFYGIDFGLPQTGVRPDEESVIWAALRIADEHSPRFFAYPSLYPMLYLTVLGIQFGVGLASGQMSSIDDLLAELAVTPEKFYLLDRVLSAMFGCATVILVFFLARRLGGRDWVGLTGALFTALAYLHVRESHFGTVDISLTFFCVLGVLNIVYAADRGSLKAFALAGFCAGLAASTKYNGVALAGPIFLAVLVQVQEEGRNPILLRALQDGRLWTAGVTLIIGFLLGTPFLLWDWTTFVDNMTSEVASKLGEDPYFGVDLGRGWFYHLHFSLLYGCGLAMLLLSLYGALMSLRSLESRMALLILAFPFCWWLAVGSSRSVFVRYAVPLVPFVGIFGAVGLGIFAKRIDRLLSPILSYVVIFGVFVAACAFPLYKSIQFGRLLKQTDSRALAVEWLDSNLKGGATVGQEPGLGAVELWPTAELMKGAGTSGQGRVWRHRINHLLKGNVKGYVPMYYIDEEWKVGKSQELTDAVPDVVLLRSYPLVYEVSNPNLREKIKRSYHLVKSIQTLPPQGKYVFDKQDAFYLPFADFGAVRRPGPNLEIWIRNRHG